MKLFPLSLKEKVKTQLNNLRPFSIRNQGDLQLVFLQKFFLTHRTSALKKNISNFKAMEDKKFFACWERFREIVVLYPHHRFDNQMLVLYFYESMTSSSIKAEVTGSNPKGVVEGEIVSRSEGWPRPSTPFVFAVGAWVNAL